jgi:uncharacterized protein (DUF885 family)
MLPRADHHPPSPRLTRRRLLQGGTAALVLAGAGRTAAAAQPDREAFRRFLDTAYADMTADDPEWQTALGLKGSVLTRWTEMSEAHDANQHAIVQRSLARLERDFPAERLEPADRLSRRLFVHDAGVRLQAWRWRRHSYTLDHLSGRHTRIPELLITYHRIGGEADAEAYVARLRAVPDAVDQLIAATELRRADGVVPPAFSLTAAAAACRQILAGRPFEPGEGAADSRLLADFRGKVAAAGLPASRAEPLVAEATAALRDRFGPAYRRLAEYIAELAQAAPGDRGVWSHPDGEAYYDWCLLRHTTLPLTARELHAAGLEAVAELQAQMLAGARQLGLPAGLPALFRHLREDERLYYPDSDDGRAAYLADARAMLARMTARLPTQFRHLPRTPLEVRRFEPFQEPYVPVAQYRPGALDGSRPGIYFVNLRNMREMPRYNMEVLAFHEAVPGHHLQLSLAQELGDLPAFRRTLDFTAFSEGWGLYCERLAKEMGFYEDPHAELGRLGYELWRAVRLVVDTGIHALRWTREHATAYFADNVPLPPETARREVDRYFVLPGQACSYRVGMLKMMSLRAQAQDRLGSRFDIRDFHEAVLGNGALPLPVLEEVLSAWSVGRAG